MSPNNNQNNKHANKPPLTEAAFLTHLFELRDRLLRSVVVVVVIFLALFSFANDLYHILATPLISHLPEGSQMISTGVVSPFLTPIKLALVASIFLAVPFLLYQAWAFIAPGLYQHEKHVAFPLLISSIILFYLGMAFAYYVVFPLVFEFLSTTTPEGISHTPDISVYLDFSLKMFFAFGIAFEVPIATILFILTGMADPDKLVQKRPYIIVGAFIIGMLLTPPDVISQTLLALPMWLLFEVGVIIGRIMKRRHKEEKAAFDEEQERELTEEEMDDEFEKAIAEEERLRSEGVSDTSSDTDTSSNTDSDNPKS